MSTFSKYKKLEKPIALERYSIDIVNKNNDIIDSELHKLELKNESQDNLLATKEALNTEVSRAITKENVIESSLNSEISRAQSAEYQISRDLDNEINRAFETESNINTNLSNHISNHDNPHNVTKSQVGLSDVDNTSDVDKPVSSAQRNALDLAVSTHNTSNQSHSDIRQLISGLTTRLNALADSDDTTLDQLSEIVSYIKNNKSLIDNITTSKVSVSDIIDNITSSNTNKPLSAKQGKVLKDLIDTLTTVVGNKVDKVSGKELSTNDYTNEEKNKLRGIATGAEVNVQPDWNVTDSTSDAFIKNKPDIESSTNGSVTVVSPLRVEGGMFVNNGIPQGYGDSSYFMCFNAYTSDAAGGKVSYRNRKDVGFADQWHWQTTANNLNKFCKIYLKHGNYGFHPSSMFSFNLEIYQSYEYWKISISGYRLIDTDGVRWYSPHATLIDTTDTTDGSFRIIFGKDADDKLWIAFPSMIYTGVSICNINTGYIDPAPLFDTNSAFDIAIESSLTGTIQFDQCIWGPIKRNEFNELKNFVSNGKAAVASAITAKGVSTATTADFSTMAANIKNIKPSKSWGHCNGLWWLNGGSPYSMKFKTYMSNPPIVQDVVLNLVITAISNGAKSSWRSVDDWVSLSNTKYEITIKQSGTLLDISRITYKNPEGYNVKVNTILNPWGTDDLKGIVAMYIIRTSVSLSNDDPLEFEIIATPDKASYELVSISLTADRSNYLGF